MRLLIKIPSRERPQILLEAASRYAKMASNKEDTTILITADIDDDSMSQDEIADALIYLPVRVCIRRDHRSTKVEAYNRDLPGDEPWDVLVVASDDMWPVVEGYDDVIRAAMRENYPDTDGVLWFCDGRQQRICTMPIIGRTYYDRFGYVYNPIYASYYCDDELTARALELGKLTFDQWCIIRDEHPQWRNRSPVPKVPNDDLYDHNRKAKAQDRALYAERKAAGFP